MQTWETYKKAVLEYSKLKPIIKTLAFVPTVDTKVQTLPTDCLIATFVDYGELSTFQEVYVSETADQGWYENKGTLFLTPAPTTTDPITVIYSAQYVPGATVVDGFTPALPEADLPYIDDLEQAIILEAEADDIAKGPTAYSVGQTQISRSAGLVYLQQRARELRQRVAQSLSEPVALWL